MLNQWNVFRKAAFFIWKKEKKLYNILFLSLLFSDAFDVQYGVVVIRLKEGLDISHLQGQGMTCFVPSGEFLSKTSF